MWAKFGAAINSHEVHYWSISTSPLYPYPIINIHRSITKCQSHHTEGYLVVMVTNQGQLMTYTGHPAMPPVFTKDLLSIRHHGYDSNGTEWGWVVAGTVWAGEERKCEETIQMHKTLFRIFNSPNKNTSWRKAEDLFRNDSDLKKKTNWEWTTAVTSLGYPWRRASIKPTYWNVVLIDLEW